MERWVGKIAVVTGASAGIGAAIVVDLVKAGCIVVGLARRQERVEELKTKVLASATGKLHALKCDVSNEEDIKSAFAWIENNLGAVHILVNNAGVVRTAKLIDADNSVPLREVIDTNIMGLVFCTREAFQSMKKHNVDDGHIILINSIVGHCVPYLNNRIPSLNIYPASKYAVTAITEVLRQEFQAESTKIKISVNLFHTNKIW